MGGEDVAIEAAGGLDDGAIGTDAERVRAAVERVRSPDGVLVLMDLGSALMSAEMATEMLEPEGGPVALSAAPLVEGAVAAAARARGGASLDEVAREARGRAADEDVAASARRREDAAARGAGRRRRHAGRRARAAAAGGEPRSGCMPVRRRGSSRRSSDFDARVEVRNATRATPARPTGAA